MGLPPRLFVRLFRRKNRGIGECLECPRRPRGGSGEERGRHRHLARRRYTPHRGRPRPEARTPPRRKSCSHKKLVRLPSKPGPGRAGPAARRHARWIGKFPRHEESERPGWAGWAWRRGKADRWKVRRERRTERSSGASGRDAPPSRRAVKLYEAASKKSGNFSFRVTLKPDVYQIVPKRADKGSHRTDKRLKFGVGCRGAGRPRRGRR